MKTRKVAKTKRTVIVVACLSLSPKGTAPSKHRDFRDYMRRKIMQLRPVENRHGASTLDFSTATC
jgi:hypothetical protein